MIVVRRQPLVDGRELSSDQIRRYGPVPLFIVDTNDIHFLRLQRAAALSDSPPTTYYSDCDLWQRLREGGRAHAISHFGIDRMRKACPRCLRECRRPHPLPSVRRCPLPPEPGTHRETKVTSQ